MRELIGNCCSCGKELFCFDGFFSGVKVENDHLMCFDCYEKIEHSTK